ncbi:MAG: lamin tail domain-containing protein [Candidatus Microthrix sp.]|uniref:Lamin tail domain-containing protein n=1 Tax=Candidatus Neomicrothrix subdominans TaxID=2954438 RepID=A0A936NCR8_9ACTN|nr:lamin tail domain-containing protein [Candidatus Microthrix sp.]MBK9297279.1 lamin tail domain-containing protein [Candidatus Microthrix subdominans]
MAIDTAACCATNTGHSTIDLTGWGLKDESASHRYGFPDRFELPAGAAVRVASGCGTDRADHLHWCMSNSAVWNNSGDTAFLLDPNGNIFDTYRYDATGSRR